MEPWIDFFATIAWPAVFAGALFYFRVQIKDILKRVTRVSHTGFDIAAPSSQTTGNSSSEESASEAAVTLGPLVDDPAILPWEKIIRDTITDHNLAKADNLEDRLIRALAYSSRLHNFEQISRQIFGTQIALLRHLKDSDPQPKDALTDIYEEHELRSIDYVEYTDPTFERWIAFLLHHQLVKFDGGKYAITVFGRQYLEFADSIGVRETRSL